MKTFLALLATLGVIWFLFWGIWTIRIATSEQNVSGIAYNVKNDSFISGNSRFSLRAAVDTYVTEENQSSYCLPPDSPYIALVNEAAENKDIKLSVKTTKVFKLVSAPWVCVDNVTVTKVK